MRPWQPFVGVLEARQFPADDTHALGCFNSERNTLPMNPLDHNDNPIADHHLFTDFATEYEHFETSASLP